MFQVLSVLGADTGPILWVWENEATESLRKMRNLLCGLMCGLVNLPVGSHGTSHILEKEESPLLEACPSKAVCCCITVELGLWRHMEVA